MSTFDFNAPVMYIRDLNSSDSVELPLARAVMVAVAEHQDDMEPLIVGDNIELIGIEAIQAVYDLDEFPKHRQ